MGWIECHGGDHSKQSNLQLVLFLYTLHVKHFNVSWQVDFAKYIFQSELVAKGTSSLACTNCFNFGSSTAIGSKVFSNSFCTRRALLWASLDVQRISLAPPFYMCCRVQTFRLQTLLSFQRRAGARFKRDFSRQNTSTKKWWVESKV